MNDLFDDPGDLGFFDQPDEYTDMDDLENPFYEPAPGEEDYYE